MNFSENLNFANLSLFHLGKKLSTFSINSFLFAHFEPRISWKLYILTDIINVRMCFAEKCTYTYIIFSCCVSDTSRTFAVVAWSSAIALSTHHQLVEISFALIDSKIKGLANRLPIVCNNAHGILTKTVSF